MRRILWLFFILLPLSVFADDVCPAGYTDFVDYTQLEYIESTGIQWLDTGYKAPTNNYIKISGKIAFTSFQTTAQFLIPFGAYRAATPVDFLLTKTSNDSTSGYVELGSNFSFASLPTIYKNVPFEFSVSLRNGMFTGFIDSQTYEKQFTSSINSADTLALFASKSSGTVSTGYAIVSARVYRWTGYDTAGKKIVDLIPVKQIASQKIGMYDNISKTFIPNMGSGNFIAGPEISIDKCYPCPENTYKPNAGNGECLTCPEHTYSPEGASECGRVLRVKDYAIYMPRGKRAEHGLCTMLNDVKYCADVYPVTQE